MGNTTTGNQTESQQYDAIKNIVNKTSENQEKLTNSVTEIKDYTKQIVNALKDFNTKSQNTNRSSSNRDSISSIMSRNSSRRDSGGEYVIDSTTGRIKNFSQKENQDRITKQQMTTVINILTTGFKDVTSPLKDISGGLFDLIGDGFNQIAKINKDFDAWTGTFNKLPWTNSKFLQDQEGKNYQGTLTNLFGDLMSSKKVIGSNGQIIDSANYSKPGEWQEFLTQAKQTGALASIPQIATSVAAIVGPVVAIAGIMSVFKFLLESIKTGVEVIKEREETIRKDEYYTENMRGMSLDAKREEWLYQAMGIQELRGLSKARREELLNQWQKDVENGIEVSITPVVKNPLHSTNLYGTQTANVAGFSGTIMSIKEQIAGFYNVLKEIRNSVAGGAGYAQMVYQWEDRMNVSGLASGELFKTATRWYDNAGSVLNNIYSQVYNTSEHLNVTADQLITVGNNYAKYLKVTTKNDEEFSQDMDKVIHVAGLLEDYGINANEWLSKMHSFGKGTLSDAANNSMWTAFAMAGLNPVEEWGALQQGDLGQVSERGAIKIQEFFRQFAGNDIASANTRAIFANQLGIDAEMATQMANGKSFREAFAEFGERSKGPSVKQLDIMSKIYQDLSQRKSLTSEDIQYALDISMYGSNKAGASIYNMMEKIHGTLASFQRSIEKFIWGDVKRYINAEGKSVEEYTAGALAKKFGVKDSIVYVDDSGNTIEKEMVSRPSDKGALNTVFKIVSPAYTWFSEAEEMYADSVQGKGVTKKSYIESVLGKEYWTEKEYNKLKEQANKNGMSVENYVAKNQRTNEQQNYGYNYIANKLGISLEELNGKIQQGSLMIQGNKVYSMLNFSDKFVKNTDNNDFIWMAKYASGISNIPYDNYPALLHKDERVLNAVENEEYSQGTAIARMALKQFIVNSAERPLYVTFDQSEIIRIRQILENQYTSNTPTQEETLQQELTTTSVPTSNDIYMYV